MGTVVPFRRNPQQFANGRRPRRYRILGIPVSLVFVGGVVGVVVLLRPVLDPKPVALNAAVTVVDGDSLRTSDGDIRILNIDAPELHQTCRDEKGREWSCGREARKRMVALIAGGDVVCTSSARDKYGRTLATCKAKGVDDLGAAMVRDGWAINFGGENGPYVALEDEARAAKRGIWRGTFTQPRTWRDAHPRTDEVQKP